MDRLIGEKSPMDVVVLLVGLGLVALWIIGLSTAAAAGWYLWLTLAAGVVLLLGAAASSSATRRLR
jgi:hypothetical protein